MLLREYGKLRLYAKGGARPQNKHGGALRLFAYLDFVIYKGDGFFSLNQCDGIYLFDKLTEDYDKIFYASYFAELTDKTVLEAEPCPEILDLLLYALRALEKGAMPAGLIRAAFELRLLMLLGFSPVSDECADCGSDSDLRFFSEFGLLCASCNDNKTAVPITEAAVFALNFILTKDIKGLFSFSLTGADKDALINAAGFFLKAHITADIKSRGFLP